MAGGGRGQKGVDRAAAGWVERISMAGWMQESRMGREMGQLCGNGMHIGQRNDVDVGSECVQRTSQIVSMGRRPSSDATSQAISMTAVLVCGTTERARRTSSRRKRRDDTAASLVSRINWADVVDRKVAIGARVLCRKEGKEKVSSRQACEWSADGDLGA